MRPRMRRLLGAAALLPLIGSLPVAVGSVGEFKFQSVFGTSTFVPEDGNPDALKNFPSFETIVPVPSIIRGLSDDDLIPVFCDIVATNGGRPVKKAQATIAADLFVLDNNTGEFEMFSLESGKLTTDTDGAAEFDFEIPAPIFADGFESGDISAWSYTRTEFTKKKQGDRVTTACASGRDSSERTRPQPLFATVGGDELPPGNAGNSTLFSSPACPVNQFPSFESIAPVPAIIDPFEADLIPVFCEIGATNGSKAVKNAKGTFTADLLVLDNTTGFFDSFRLGDGKFKTGSDGFDSLEFEIPAPIFADGFESGDVSAWSYTRADFSNKKKADSAGLSCDIGSSKSR